MLEIGSVVDGKYKILNKLGSSWGGIAYTATNENNEIVDVTEYCKHRYSIELFESLKKDLDEIIRILIASIKTTKKSLI